MEDTLVEVRDLYYTYSDDHDALQGISVKIRQGERVAVVGSNGAGKSTFFLNLNGVLTPSSGEILYRGRVMGRSKKDLNELRRKIGIVFQDADNQIIASTVMGEVSFGPMNLKLPREEVVERVEEALAYMNITEFRDRPPHYLSGGEKKRVSIADIIAMKPELIIFDEPTAALDPLNAGRLEYTLSRLGEQGMTMLISTHDIDFAYRWADRVLVFAQGSIIADGDPVAVFKDMEVLLKAHLRRPTLLDMYDLLVEQGKLPDEGRYPRKVEDFAELLS